MFMDIYEEGFENIFLALGFASVIILILLIPILVVYCIGAYKMMKKTGKRGWEIFVPIYSWWVLVELSGLHSWYFFLIIAGTVISLLGFEELASIFELVSSIATIFCYYNIGKKFNKGTGFAIAMAIIPGIMIPIAGFSNDYVFDINTPVSPNGPINSNSSNNQNSDENIGNQNNNIRYCTNCGTKINIDTKYCINCGNEIK